MTERNPAPAGEIRFLNLIALVAIVDVLLLIPLVWASRWVAHREDLVAVLGPIHGMLFIALIGLCAWGAHRKWWGWWFPLITVITFGPPGSLIGDFLIRRRLREQAAAGPGTAVAPGAGVKTRTDADAEANASPREVTPEAAEL